MRSSLFCNLTLSLAGAWAGFDEEWLIERIKSRLRSKNLLNDAGLEISYQTFKWMCRNYWRRLEKIYTDIKENQDSYIVTCRTAFITGVFPFQFEKSQQPVYQKLYAIALGYRNSGRLEEFCQFLQEGQYHMNIWTAYFLLEILELDKTVRTEELKDKKSIFDHCYRTIENTSQSFKDKNQIRNCSYWIEEKRRTMSAFASQTGAHS